MHEEQFDRSGGVIVWLLITALIVADSMPFILEKIFS